MIEYTLILTRRKDLKMKEKIINENIDRLNISCKLIELLKQNKITKISQLCNKTKTNLRNINLTNTEISQVEIELQLLGLDLKNNY